MLSDSIFQLHSLFSEILKEHLPFRLFSHLQGTVIYGYKYFKSSVINSYYGRAELNSIKLDYNATVDSNVELNSVVPDQNCRIKTMYIL